jgi:hypothetical protein
VARDVLSPIAELIFEDMFRAIGTNRPKCMGTREADVIPLMRSITLNRDKLVAWQNVARPAILERRQIDRRINLRETDRVSVGEVCMAQVPKM